MGLCPVRCKGYRTKAAASESTDRFSYLFISHTADTLQYYIHPTLAQNWTMIWNCMVIQRCKNIVSERLCAIRLERVHIWRRFILTFLYTWGSSQERGAHSVFLPNLSVLTHPKLARNLFYYSCSLCLSELNAFFTGFCMKPSDFVEGFIHLGRSAFCSPSDSFLFI